MTDDPTEAERAVSPVGQLYVPAGGGSHAHPHRSPQQHPSFLFWERMIDRAERLVFDRPLWVLIPVVAAVAVIKDGIGKSPNIAVWIQIARVFPGDPHLAGGSLYQLSSPIGPALAHALGAYTPNSYAALHLVAALAAVATMLVGLHRAAGRAGVGVGLVAFFASPLSNILFTWLGQQDPFTVLFASAAALFTSPTVLVIAGIGLGVSHPEVGVLVVLSVGALRLVDTDRRTPLAAAGLAAGFVVGAVATSAYEHHAGGSASAAMTFIRSVGVGNLSKEFLQESPAWAFTTLGAWWFFLGALGRSLLTRPTAVVVVTLGVVATVISVLTADESRVFALIALPVVLWLCVRAVRTLPAPAVRRATAITFLLAVAIPRLVVWAGITYVSAWHFSSL